MTVDVLLISHTIRNTRRVLLAFRQYIRGLEVLFCSCSEGDGGDASSWWVELLCGMSLFSGTMMPLGWGEDSGEGDRPLLGSGSVILRPVLITLNVDGITQISLTWVTVISRLNPF